MICTCSTVLNKIGNITNQVKVFSLGEEIQKYMKNYFKYILRMPTYRILRKIVDYNLKEEERKVDHQICERILLTRRTEQAKRPKAYDDEKSSQLF
jgi:hypothetical protein